MSFPDTIQANAWRATPNGNRSELANLAIGWGAKPEEISQKLGADDPPDSRNWKDPRVGWGLVLLENTDIEAAERATANDAPEPIKRLWEHRGSGPVFRYSQQLPPGCLRRYSSSGQARDPKIEGSEQGTEIHQIPKYLLIYGGPDKIPWMVQYQLNLCAYVGRLDLAGQELDNYVSALIGEWENAESSSNQPVVWSVDLEGGDITTLMRQSIAQPIVQELTNDNQIGDKVKFLTGNDASIEKLTDTLVERKPALVISTSHGMTEPLGDLATLRAQLGSPTDFNDKFVVPETLLNVWQPDGAIWYSHACCSAGADKVSSYKDLFSSDSDLGTLLNSIAGLDSMTAPLPQRLLGAEKPLRAFVGHVEPTFDWTLRDNHTRQVMTSSIRDSLYSGLHRSSGHEPIGMALEGYFDGVGSLLSQSMEAETRVNDHGELDLESTVVQRKLAAFDRRSLVILGDPTVALPKLQ